MVGEKNAFWHALVLTVCVFLLGISIGVILENSRQNSAERLILNSETSLADFQIRGNAISGLNLSCEETRKELFSFADKIYEDSVQLERYDGASKFSDILIEAHKKYDLLRVVLLTESYSLKSRCKMNYTNVVYLYNYKEDDENVKSRQVVMSKLLERLKRENPDTVLLIPIAGNLDLTSVDFIIKSNSITNIPAIFSDNGNIIYETTDYTDFREVIFEKR